MKHSKYILMIILLGCLFCGSRIVYASALSGFETEEMSMDEIEVFLDNVKISMFNTEPSKVPIECFDVNERGMLAIGTADESLKIICIYSNDGIFQYGYRFETYGSFEIEWSNEVLNIYFVRSDVSVSINPTGEIEEVSPICDTIENNTYWNQISKTNKSMGEYQYVLKNDIGLLGIFASDYSQLYKIDKQNNEWLIYDVNTFQFFHIVAIFVGVIIFASIVVVVIIKDFKKRIEKGEYLYDKGI